MAMNYAVSNSHLDIVKWLLENRTAWIENDVSRKFNSN